jgi:hypothetical protein
MLRSQLAAHLARLVYLACLTRAALPSLPALTSPARLTSLAQSRPSQLPAHLASLCPTSLTHLA